MTFPSAITKFPPPDEPWIWQRRKQNPREPLRGEEGKPTSSEE